MKYTLLYLFVFLFTSCKTQTFSIEYDIERPSEAQINYTKNEADKTKHYIIFRSAFGSETVKLYDGKELIDEGKLKPVDQSLGIEHISIIDRKTRKIKIVFDSGIYYLNLKKEYQYAFLDNYDGDFTALLSKYVKFDF